MAPLPPDVRLTLVTDTRRAWYSGMIPGLVAGHYAAHEAAIDLQPLARRAGACVIVAAATGFDPEAKRLSLHGRPDLAYDVISFNIGATASDLPFASLTALTIRTRPMDSLVRSLAALDHRAAAGTLSAVVVVGGGVAGCELALALTRRLHHAKPAITLLEREARLLPREGARLRRAVTRALNAAGVTVRLGVTPTSALADQLILSEGTSVRCDALLWAAQVGAHDLFASAGVAVDGRGFALVRDTLQLRDHDQAFAVGDCATLIGRPVPKAGVYAVRAAPWLEENLRAHFTQRPLLAFRPQRGFLRLINTADGRGIGARFGLAATGRWAWRLKDRIDRGFMSRLQLLQPDGRPAPHAPPMAASEDMVCGGCAAKLGPGPLARALGRAGLGGGDDAALSHIGPGESPATLVSSVDGFRAFTEDDFLLGRVAAVNAVSDLDATGATPTVALAAVTLPVAEGRPDLRLEAILDGIGTVLTERGARLIGGHTTLGPETFVALSVHGTLPPDTRPLTKGGLRAGDALVLTRPIGTGVLLAGDMRGLASGHWMDTLERQLVRDGGPAAHAARAAGARGVTDVTGFGLLGHAIEMADASQVTVVLNLSRLPVLPGATQLSSQGVQSTAFPRLASLFDDAHLPASIKDRPEVALLIDPQTAGGLLIGIPHAAAQGLVEALIAAGEPDATLIGHTTARGSHAVVITSDLHREVGTAEG